MHPASDIGSADVVLDPTQTETGQEVGHVVGPVLDGDDLGHDEVALGGP